MRQNSVRHTGQTKRKVLLCVILCAVIALCIGISYTYQKLHAIWVEQCEITDLQKQVSIQTGEYIKAAIVLEKLGIKKGANFAKIDFEKKQREALEKITIAKSITIIRHLPNRIEIHVEERTPVARIVEKGTKRKRYWLSVDSEGAVFERMKNTATLPMIYAKREYAKDGITLTGRTKAALNLLEMSKQEFPALDIQAVDATHEDYIVATLKNYSIAKIAWKGMDYPTIETEGAMKKQLSQLESAYKSVGANVKVWNVTLPNRATGDTKEPIL